MKKIWTKPVLTMVTKNEAEENVLGTCKKVAEYTGGPSANANNCNVNENHKGVCKGVMVS